MSTIALDADTLGDTETQLLRKLVAILGGARDGTSPLIVDTEAGAGATRTPALTSVTASGSVTAGKKSVAFLASDDFVGTVAGGTLPAGKAISFEADGSDTLSAIAYTRSAGTLYIGSLT